ncbi:MAG: EAL domain-containing protein [Sedimenticola sp.]
MTKLGLSTSLVAVISGLVLSLVIYANVKNILQDRVIEDQHTIADNLIYEIDHFLFLAQRDLNMLIEDEFLQSYMANPEQRSEKNRGLLEEELEERMELTGPWNNLVVLDLDGNHLFTPGSTAELHHISNYPDSQAGFLAARSGHIYSSNQVESDYSGGRTVIFAAPIRAGEDEGESEGEVVGVIIGHYHWGAIENLLATKLTHGSRHLFDLQGEVLGYQSHGPRHDSHEAFSQHPLIRQALAGELFGYGTFGSADEPGLSFSLYVGEPGYRNYHGKGWRLLIEIPEGELFSSARALSLRTGMLTFLAFMLLMILLITTTRRTIRPLDELNQKANLIGEGDYEQHISLQSNDEIGELASSFNRMANSLKKNAAELAHSQQRYHDLVNEIDDGIIATDAEGLITFANAPFLGMIGQSDSASVIGSPLESFLVPEKQEELHSQLHRNAPSPSLNRGFETVLLQPDGKRLFIQLRHVPIIDKRNEFCGIRAVVRDINVQKATEQEIVFRASHDSLTGLPNRDMLFKTLGSLIAHGKRHGGEIAILFIDLDEFKLVNDTLGHDAGDELLCEVGERLEGALRETDTLARHGGDEFILIVTDHCDANQKVECENIFYGQVSTITQRLLQLLEKPFVIREQEVYVGASIGISTFPSDGNDSLTLLQHADSAMYRAKELGRNTYQFYSRELSERQEKRVFLANRLHKAVEQQEFVLHYQPIVELSSGRMIGVEALIRWNDEGKIIPPNDFIPVAEATGMILPIGDWVLQETCRQLQVWEERGIDLYIAANLSVKQFWKGDITRKLLDNIHTFNVDKKRLELEITESAMTLDAARMEAVLGEFKTHGLAISLDDFGTGYSSLDRLKHLPINKLKIDRSFVDGVPLDQDDAAIVTAVIQMSSNLGIDSLAEGIETEQQWHYLREQGCLYGQGYYFSRPVPVETIEAIWSSREEALPHLFSKSH